MNERVKNIEEREEKNREYYKIESVLWPSFVYNKNKTELARLFCRNKTELARPSLRQFRPNRTLEPI
jgi:hypothetical protein